MNGQSVDNKHVPEMSDMAYVAPVMGDGNSEEVGDIMGKMPSWASRWGITVTSILLLVVLTSTYFIHFPETLDAKVIVSSSAPPIRMVSRASAPIQKLLVGNNELVKEGDILCVLSNSSKYGDVELVAKYATLIDTSITPFEIKDKLLIPSGLQLGELQTQYTELLQSIQQYKFFLSQNTYKAKVEYLVSQSKLQTRLIRELEKKSHMLKEQLDLRHEHFEIDSGLALEKVISRLDYDETRRKFIDEKINTEGNDINILENMLLEREYKKNISETMLELQGKDNELQQKIRDAAKKFRGLYAVWQQNYIFKSPIAGRVVLFNYWKENQFVQTGENVLTVIPQMSKYIVKGSVGMIGAGKVKNGQKVLIKLYAYPYKEYGVLIGSVNSISTVSMDSSFALEISLKRGLTTNLNKKISEYHQLEGMGEILLDDKSIFERLFENIFGSWRKYV
ncbi:HlyD family secretion protein [Chitinophaga polysaccharea]|uniref:HlyD family secretion protein n=1 Tax=Chitinophaga polysaccharea TaxID=1293035 RepID=UPI001157249C|nr:HlyD family efflux transporter periplasmic adaptor subunit [Chitinophaga polysaccharea]